MTYEINEKGRVIAIYIRDGENYPLDYIPRFIFNFKYLEILRITSNGLLCIPYAIKRLRHLKELNLSYNPIFLISNSIALLKSLEKLELSQHHLQEFPKVVFHLLNLKYLDLVSDSNDEPKPFTQSKELTTQLKVLLKEKIETILI
jgi:Leucine-rich repeat (LRR) protein